MKLLPITCALLAITASGYAQEETNAGYNAALNKLEKHPALEAVRQQVTEQREASNGAGGLPDPMLMLGINNYPADGSGGLDRFAMTSKSIGFVQKIPNGGIRAASVNAKKHLADKAQIAVDFTRQQLVAALHTALANKNRVASQQKLVQQDINLLKQEGAYWDGRLQAGESTLDERSRVEAELAQDEAKLATLQAEGTEFMAELQRLVGESGDVDIPELFALPWPNAQGVYPVLLSEKDVLVARSNVSGAESAFKPSYQMGATFAQRDNSGNFDGGDFVSAQVGISIPLWAWKNQSPKLRSAQAGVNRAEAQLMDTESQWRQQLATQFAKIKETQATQKALREKEKSIQTQITSLRGSYESGGRLDMLIAAKRSLLGLKLQLADLKARYVQQVSGYNAFFQKTEMPEVAQMEASTPKQTPIQTIQSGGDL
jgi:outer membrane protein TolC